MSNLRQAAEAVLDAWFRSGSKILEMQPHMERLAGALEDAVAKQGDLFVDPPRCPRCNDQDDWK